MTEQTIRCSDAPINIECGKSAEPPRLEIDTSGPEATLGTACHDSLQHWTDNGFIGEPDAEPFAAQHGVDPGQVAALVQAAPGLLERCDADFVGAVAEVAIKSDIERGRMDLVNVITNNDLLTNINVVDWKTGRDSATGSKRAQRLAYASALEATIGWPMSDHIYTAEIWLACDTVIEDRFTLQDIEAYRAKLRARLERPTARPGVHCKYCRRLHECEEHDAYLRSAATALAPVAEGALTSHAIAALWDQSRALKAALAKYEQAVDALIDLTGELPLPDGRRIVRQSINRDSIDARKAWPIMTAAGLGPDQINDALSISKSKLLEAVGKLAPRGKKAIAKTDLMLSLDTAGAIARSASYKKRVLGPGKGES